MDMLISFGDLVALSPQVFSRPILLNSTATKVDERRSVDG